MRTITINFQEDLEILWKHRNLNVFTKKQFSFLKWGIACTTPSTCFISITMYTCPIGDHLSSRHSSNWRNIISWYILTRANSLVTLRFPYQCIHVALERICTCPKQVLSTSHIDSIWIKTLLNVPLLTMEITRSLSIHWHVAESWTHTNIYGQKWKYLQHLPNKRMQYKICSSVARVSITY